MSESEAEYHENSTAGEEFSEEAVAAQQAADQAEFDAKYGPVIEQTKHFEAQNKGLMGYLAKMDPPRIIQGLGEQRHENFFKYLIEAGIIPMGLAIEFDLHWQRSLNHSLKEMRAQVDRENAARESEKIRQRLLQGVSGVRLKKI